MYYNRFYSSDSVKSSAFRLLFPVAARFGPQFAVGFKGNRATLRANPKPPFGMEKSTSMLGSVDNILAAKLPPSSCFLGGCFLAHARRTSKMTRFGALVLIAFGSL